MDGTVSRMGKDAWEIHSDLTIPRLALPAAEPRRRLSLSLGFVTGFVVLGMIVAGRCLLSLSKLKHIVETVDRIDMNMDRLGALTAR
jgi:hypothetical protein